jgi:hypothetical protein
VLKGVVKITLNSSWILKKNAARFAGLFCSCGSLLAVDYNSACNSLVFIEFGKRGADERAPVGGQDKGGESGLTDFETYFLRNSSSS